MAKALESHPKVPQRPHAVQPLIVLRPNVVPPPLPHVAPRPTEQAAPSMATPKYAPAPPPKDLAAAEPPARTPAPSSDLRGSEREMPAAPAAAHPQVTLAPEAAAPTQPAPAPAANPGDVVRVAERLKDNLSREMFDNFELFLYVSKAAAGPWAQRMYVFKKTQTGDLVLLYNWPVSTGREEIEFNPEGDQLKTVTPPGYYELDPHRSYEHYTSGEWHQPMPFAMFFNWVNRGNETGLAIHAASGDDVAKLGHRASAGCIHLSLDNARTLFALIRHDYRGLAPRFAVDRRTGTMSNDGILLHDAQGNVKMADGYKVLVFIEDFGGENVVAALF